MKTILIPTDFSENAWNAIEYALQFLKNEECKFYFLHTYTPAFYRMDYMLGGPAMSAIPDVGIDISLAGLEKTLADVKGQFPNPKHSYETVSAFNSLTDEINELSETKGIDLIVMGTKGATGAEQLFLGTSTVFAIRKAIKPLFAIPDTCTYKPIKKILFPTDFWPRYREDELKTILDIARMHKSEIILLHVKDEYDLTTGQVDNQKVIEKLLINIPYKEIEIKGKLMPEAILEYISENQIDLLTMMNRKHSFFERILIKQNVDQIGFHVKIPFLVVRDTAELPE
ncbi:MAG: universal stress protein [Flavobacteriaceae bacterium]